MNIPRGLIIGVLLGVLALMVSCAGVETINQGHVGVKTSLGANFKSSTQTLQPGLYFYNPFTTSIHDVDIRTQTVGEEDLQVFTRDTQGVTISYKVSVRINPNNANLVFASLGTNLDSGNLGNLLLSQTRNSIKSVLASFSMDEMLKQRPVMPERITAHLRKALGDVLASSNLPIDAVVVDGFALEDMRVDEAYEQAAEAKQRATQDAERAKNETVKKEEEAKQAVIAAQAEADSKLAIAKAEAEAFRIKNDSLAKSPRLIEYTLAERWDGALPIMVSSDKASQIMDITTLSGVIEARKAARSERQLEEEIQR